MNARFEIYDVCGTEGAAMELPVRVASDENPVVVWLDASNLLHIPPSFVPRGAGAQIAIEARELAKLLDAAGIKP